MSVEPPLVPSRVVILPARPPDTEVNAPLISLAIVADDEINPKLVICCDELMVPLGTEPPPASSDVKRTDTELDTEVKAPDTSVFKANDDV